MTDWDARFLSLARHVAGWSKDPSTQVGAVIADRKHRVVGIGYNGFPRGVDDCPALYADRAEKYPRVVHAELNAILNAVKGVEGCVIYVWPFFTCCECAKAIIQAGIVRVVAPPPAERPASRYDVSETMYAEAGVDVVRMQAGSR